MNDYVSQMVLLVFTICAGIATFLSTRRPRGERGPRLVRVKHADGQETERWESPADGGQSGSLLNGYATVLQKALDRAERLQERNHELEAEKRDLTERVAELEAHIHLMTTDRTRVASAPRRRRRTATTSE